MPCNWNSALFIALHDRLAWLLLDGRIGGQTITAFNGLLVLPAGDGRSTSPQLRRYPMPRITLIRPAARLGSSPAPSVGGGAFYEPPILNLPF
jgi:hypothetical protein